MSESGVPGAELAAAVIDRLRARGETVATAESLTGGGVCATLTSVPGASDVVRGGLIVYADELKVELAGVPEELIWAKGAVDPNIAVLLAEGARERCGATWGLGLTGVAGPGPANGVPAGTVHVGIVGPMAVECRSAVFAGDRDDVRAASIEQALTLLREHLG